MDVKKLEAFLRKQPTTEMILNGSKRVQVMKAPDIFKAFQTQNMPVNEIKQTIEFLIGQCVLVKANAKDNRCTIDLSKRFDPDGSYIFVHEETNWINILMALVCVCLTLALFMHQLWPRSIRHYSSYLFYLLIGFLIFILSLGFVRLVVFVFTFFLYPPGIWLFPNLFADVGFIESFIPLWCYHGEKAVPKTEEKSD